MGLMVLGVLLVLVILILAANIRIVPQAHAYILERLGGYKETWGVGIHFKIPILDRVAKRVSLKEQVVDFEPQAVITKDNVTMQIDTVVFFQITDGVAHRMSIFTNHMRFDRFSILEFL